MTPKRKPGVESTPVHVVDVDKNVQDDAAEAIAHRAWKKEIIVIIIGGILSLASIVGTCVTAYMQNRTRNAVVDSAVSVTNQTRDVANKLVINNSEQGAKLDTVVVTGKETLTTSKQNHALSNSLMLAMKKSLAETARELANLSGDPAHVAKAELYEAAYEAHKKTHDEMQAKERK